MKKVAVVMAGGVGARLWPRSREKHPKQFIHLVGDGTMIQNTVRRLETVYPTQDIFIVTSADYKQVVMEQLPAIPEENILIEPFGRNTAPCTALAATILQDRYGDDIVMTVLPSDHLIMNVGEFMMTLETANQAARSMNGIITLGVPPTRPETGFGYIQVQDEEIQDTPLFDRGVRLVSNFAEKPDIDTATRFMQAGDFLWNTGIFVWTMRTFWQAFETYLPDHAPHFNVLKKHINKESWEGTLENAYRQLRSISLDYSIMEHAENVYVIEGSFGWSDVGSWDEVYRLSLKDTNDNLLEGNVIAINAKNCFISAREKMISLVGVDDLVVVETDDALLICKRHESQDVKEIIDFLRRKDIKHFL